MGTQLTDRIGNPLIRQGVTAAIGKTLEPAATQNAYPGHFCVVADGSHFGHENTWPGLDSWEMAGAYLLLGKTRLVLDYFDFVRASQRADGNIPFAVIPADPAPAVCTHFQNLRYPEDVFTYKPKAHQGQPGHSDMSSRNWIGLFHHWQTTVNPFGMLGPVSYILTAVEIVDATQSDEWLAGRIDSLELAGRYMLSRRSDNGLIAGAGFYMESPPRNQWDGVAQCYVARSFQILSDLNARLARAGAASVWAKHAADLGRTFRDAFWQTDHFAEYIHPDHGVVDFHGVSDVNWAAVAFGIATDEQSSKLWPLMLGATGELWHGDMPTQVVSKPYAFRDWELWEPLSFDAGVGKLYDIAAMGRVWYLDAMASLKMGAHDRVVDSVLKVCEMGRRHDWYWHERYHPLQVRDVYAAGPRGYCEYAAILVRVVLGNIDLFF